MPIGIIEAEVDLDSRDEERTTDEVDLDSLDEKQQEAVDAALSGKNVFITGGAGTGKTLTMRAIVQGLRKKYGDEFEKKIAVTGATGTAAVLAGGCTLHSATGLRVPLVVNDFRRAGHGIYKQIWGEYVEVLLLDEASMISGEFFDLFEQQVRRLRGNDKPFGGLQVILVGDVFQLPPIFAQLPEEVVKRLIPEELERGRAVAPTEKNRSTREYFLNRGMIFQSDAFWTLNLTTIMLRVPYRQWEDQTLANILAKLRLAADQKAIIELNQRCFHPLDPPDLKTADEKGLVVLLPTVRQTNEVNKQRLQDLPGESHSFNARDEVEVKAEIPENLTREELFEFKRARENVLRKSAFFEESHSACPAAKTIELKENAFVMLCANLDVNAGLVNGATGRVKSISIVGKYRQVITVEFEGSRLVNIDKYPFSSAVPGVGTCRRWQYPLRLAWAITHHRSQGKTLAGVVVDPRSFTHGQTYVALSRSPSLATLHLKTAASASDFRENPESKTFTKLTEELAEPEDIRTAVGHWRNVSLASLAERVKTVRSPCSGPPGHDEIITFGKHKGRTFSEVASMRWYAQWVIQHAGSVRSPGVKRFVDYLLKRLAETGNF